MCEHCQKSRCQCAPDRITVGGCTWVRKYHDGPWPNVPIDAVEWGTTPTGPAGGETPARIAENARRRTDDPGWPVLRDGTGLCAWYRQHWGTGPVLVWGRLAQYT